MTPEQQLKIDSLRETLIEHYIDQYPDDYIVESVKMMWKTLGHPVPYVIITRSPEECAKANAILVSIHKKHPRKKTHTKAAMAEKLIDTDVPGLEEIIKEEARSHAFWHWIASTSGWHKGADILGIEYDDSKKELLDRWSNSVETGFAREEVAIVSRKPTYVCWRNDMLDNTEGPVVEYSDCFKMWAIGGVKVDEQIVMRPETQTLKQIDEEANVEVKRIRIERYTWERYLREKNAKVLDHRRNEIEQCEESLMSCDDMRVLVCACPSTARVYALEVDPSCDTVEKAQDYLNGGRSRRIIGAS